MVGLTEVADRLVGEDAGQPWIDHHRVFAGLGLGRPRESVALAADRQHGLLGQGGQGSVGAGTGAEGTALDASLAGGGGDHAGLDVDAFLVEAGALRGGEPNSRPAVGVIRRGGGDRLAVGEDDRVHRAQALDLGVDRELGGIEDERGRHAVGDRQYRRQLDRAAANQPGLRDGRASHLADVLEPVEAGEAPGALDESPDVATALLPLVEALEVGTLEGEIGRIGLLDPDLEVLAEILQLPADAREVLLEIRVGGDGHRLTLGRRHVTTVSGHGGKLVRDPAPGRG